MGATRRVAYEVLRRYPRVRPVLPRSYHAYPGPGGWVYLDLRESPMMLARALWIYEPAKVLALQSLMGPGKVFVDVGGNKGDFSLIAARVSADVGRVLCVEAEPQNAAWIRRSVERNRYRSVEVVSVALSDRDGDATLHLGEKSGWHTLVDDPAATLVGAVTVPTRTLDGLLEERGIEKVDVIKVDVEGAEDLVFAGGERTLSNTNPMTVLLDLHPPRIDAVALCRKLEGWGFDLRDPGRPSRPLPGGPSEGLREVIAVRG